MWDGSAAVEKRRARPEAANAASLLTALYLDHAGALRSYLTTVLRSPADAEDIMQDAFLRLHRSEKLETYENPRAVLYKTAHRLALNLIRKRRTSVLDRAAPADALDDLPTADEASAEEALIAREEDAAYAEALEQLSPRCRQVIELRTVAELPFKDISETLGISVSTLEKHLVRGKRRCAEIVAGWRAAAAA
jgi:RNA polymerase sigma factor (sigma-70 family)